MRSARREASVVCALSALLLAWGCASPGEGMRPVAHQALGPARCLRQPGHGHQIHRFRVSVSNLARRPCPAAARNRRDRAVRVRRGGCDRFRHSGPCEAGRERDAGDQMRATRALRWVLMAATFAA